MKSLEFPVRVAIIGLGHIGKFHIRAIQQFRELELVAVCDRKREFEALTPTGVTFYSDFEELLDRKDIDTVIIATPNHTHYYIARTVLNAGFHIILEKPAAESMAEIEKLESVARQKKLQIYYAFHAASSFDVDWFVKHLSEPKNKIKFGAITSFYCRFYDPYVNSGRLDPGADGLQDPWFDSGINALSVIQRFIPVHKLKVENASAAINYSGKPRFLQCHVEYSFTTINDFESLGYGVIDTNWTSGRNHKSTILQFARNGLSVRICHSSQKVYLHDQNQQDEFLLNDCSHGKNRLYNHYIGVFRDYVSRYSLGIMNNEDSLAAHKKLFETESMINQPL